jgi:GH43 family beta-xylosidase
MKIAKFFLLILLINHCFPGKCFAQEATTFSNPLLPAGADPWCIYRDGFYYYTHTTGRNITLWKTKTIAGLKTAEKKIIFTPPEKGPYSKELWAPEIHFLQGKWYVYFAADSGNNTDHRLWVLENRSPDPLQGEWKLKGKLTTPEDKWSIDGSLFEHKKQLYFIWSGWEGDANGQQNIYIAKMKNPWSVEGRRAKISGPELEWEIHGDTHNPKDVPHVNVNEGPEVLVHNNKLFLIYSASGCWTDFYALGMLTASANSDIMDPASWKKSAEPVFRQSKENSVYAPGHNSFFTSADGKEDWILYHANSKPGQGCGGFRSPRAQPFTWKKDGSPYFGIPVKEGAILAAPSAGKWRK